jgi:hypothetical protein
MRKFDSLSDREMLTLAISLEEDDERMASTWGSAKVGGGLVVFSADSAIRRERTRTRSPQVSQPGRQGMDAHKS